jgi:hypothetical protein
VRGSPIRKSSDQRSVDSSPRLIAASYVLHRLLVPRHPPCALKNLATQKSHPSTPGRTSMSGPTQTLDYRVRRCSRPLCSSQRTTRHRSPDPAEPNPPRRTAGGTRCRPAPTEKNGRPLPQDPTACPRPRTRDDSGPHAPGGTPYWEPATSRRPNWSAFHPRAPPHTLRRPFQNERPIPVRARLCTTRQRLAVKCSLERR